MAIRENTKYYPKVPFEREHTRIANEVFLVEVLSVDFERRVLTVRDIKDNLIYGDISVFPANTASFESVDINMPEPGAIGVACNWAYEGTFRFPIIVAWVQSQVYIGIDAIANRPITGDSIQGYTDRTRLSYRKAYPGSKTSTYTGGFSERIDTAWDRQTADLSRDKLDSDKRQWTQIAGRRVAYSDAGVSYQGSVSRPASPNTVLTPSTVPTPANPVPAPSSIVPTLLPDGTNDYIAYLQPGAQPSDRYTSGKPDVIPFSEHTELVQEFSLDYPVPYEVLQTPLLDTILGTTADPWLRTTVTPANGTVPAFDSESFEINQGWDDPFDDRVKAVGPLLNEGVTPQRRGYIMESTAGTLVGYNLFDTSTYGRVLKPQLFVGTPNMPYLGKFGASVESGYAPVVDSTDHAEARLAASCLAIRFPYEQNTTRLNVTKEGLVQMEIGSTLPKENIPLMPTNGYEYSFGAGRSLEANIVGSAQVVFGKNRDEEESLDLTALGQVVLRLGSDDTSVPNPQRNDGRVTQTQIRSRKDLVGNRTLQFWGQNGVALKPGDAGSLTMKTGGESVSLRGAFDGGTVLRLGAKDPSAKRRHLYNGYQDGPGKHPYGINDAARVDSKSYRADYGAGDSVYQFHDLTQAGSPILPSIFQAPYVWSGTPITSQSQPGSPMDSHGQSLDLHAVRDILLRVGANPDSNQSILIDTAGGLVFDLGTDNQGRSITAALEGGVEITIKANKQGKALRLMIDGDIDISQRGNLNYYCSGDATLEYTTRRQIVKTDNVETQQKKISASLVRDTTEAPDIVHNQGLYQSDENS
jgi:hypothetical protein